MSEHGVESEGYLFVFEDDNPAAVRDEASGTPAYTDDFREIMEHQMKYVNFVRFVDKFRHFIGWQEEDTGPCPPQLV